MTAEAEPAAPALSIVVVMLQGRFATHRLLDGLSKQSVPCEILVAGAAQGDPHPDAVWLEPPPDASVPARRCFAAARAAGDIVAFVEDTISPGPDWAEAVCELHARHPNAQAIGGTLRLDTAALSPRALALTLLDAGRFVAAHAVSEVVNALPGCNMSFKRAALERLGVLSGAPLREAEAVPELARKPGAVRLESGMAATCVAADERGQRAVSRFQHGRLYAGHRGNGLAGRLLRALLAPLLPFVLVQRCFRVALQAGVRPLLPVLAQALWLASAWSLGEAAGYLLGPGDAERHWR